jgi:putative hydrolase of the HAD superfamily
MHRFKAVLFDLDDTLWPIVPVIQRAEEIWFAWLAQHAPSITASFTIDTLRARRRALLEEQPEFHLDLHALRHAGLTEAFLEVQEDMEKIAPAMELFAEARNAVTLFDDVLPLLNNLHGRVALGSVSNGVADLHRIGLAHYFQASVAARHVRFAKPKPEIFLAACDALDIAPSEALYIGDDPLLDVDGAQKAGLTAVWLNRGINGSPLGDVKPDMICTNLFELNDWLDTHATLLAPSGTAR